MSTAPFGSVKAKISIIEVASMYCDLIKVGTNYQAKKNPLREEKTSSLFFYPDSQKFYDFGTSEYGDIFDFVSKIEGITTIEAREKLSSLIGNTEPPKALPINNEPIKESCMSPEILLAEFDKFDVIQWDNEAHKKELLELAPEWLYKEANKKDLELFQSVVRYDKQHNTLVSKWLDNQPFSYNLITYKHRRKGQNKWVNRAGTHPNKTTFGRTFKESDTCYVVEGMHDALTAILLGINFVALPTTSYSNYEAFKIQFDGAKKVIYIAEDIQGYKCMCKLNAVVKGQILSLTQSKETKVDLSDFVMSKHSITEVLHGLRCL